MYVKYDASFVLLVREGKGISENPLLSFFLDSSCNYTHAFVTFSIPRWKRRIDPKELYFSPMC
jgi:hypothetical protein